MGDHADATLELYEVPDAIDGLDAVVRQFTLLDMDRCGWFHYAIDSLAYGADEQLCASLQALGVSYRFFHAADHEHTALLRLFTLELGEWVRPASAEGNALIPAHAIDRILEQMPLEADDVWLREALEVASGAPWRAHFEWFDTERVKLGPGQALEFDPREGSTRSSEGDAP